MTKTRAGEILYEIMKSDLLECGELLKEETERIMMEFEADFARLGIPREEVVAFCEFIMNDVNQSLEKQ